MTQVDFGTAMTYQTLKGYEAGWRRPVARISTWTSTSVMATGYGISTHLLPYVRLGLEGRRLEGQTQGRRWKNKLSVMNQVGIYLNLGDLHCYCDMLGQ